MSSCTLHIYTNRKCGCQLKKKKTSKKKNKSGKKGAKQAGACKTLSCPCCCHCCGSSCCRSHSRKSASPLHHVAAVALAAAAVPSIPSVAASAAAAPVLCAAIKTVAGDRPRASFTTALSALLPLLLLLFLLLLPALGLVVQLLRQHLHMHVFVCYVGGHSSNLIYPVSWFSWRTLDCS